MLQRNQWVYDKNQRGKQKIDDNKNIPAQNLWDTEKAILRENSQQFRYSSKKQEKSQISQKEKGNNKDQTGNRDLKNRKKSIKPRAGSFKV